MNRRQTLKLLAGAAAFAGSATTIGRAAFAQAKPAFTLPPLGYPYEALEPHIDTATMNFHHKNHHNAFITNLNGLVEKYPDLATKAPEAILSNLSAVPDAVRTPVRNNLGGHWNHTFFWELMTPGGAKAPAGDSEERHRRHVRRLRQDEGRRQAGGRRPVRLGLGVARGEGQEADDLQHAVPG